MVKGWPSGIVVVTLVAFLHWKGVGLGVRPKKMAKVEYLVHSWPVCDFFTKTKQADRFSVGKNELRGIVK